jgi:glycerol-3-phosphate acyltransferase PlsX
MVRIALDGLGGEVVAQESPFAIQKFLERHSDVELVLATTKDLYDTLKINLFKSSGEKVASRLHFVEAKDRIDFHESPVKAVRSKPQCSIVQAVDEVCHDRCGAVVSFGHTGAAVVAAQWKLGLLPGVARSGLGAILPNAKGFGLLMDVGANLKCRAEHLFQYGVMADVYCQWALGLDRPRIGLLNVGEEPGKGDELLQSTYELLKERADFCFVGNVEGGQIFDGSVDAILCNGIEGNMVLKSAEGLANMLFESISERLEDGEDGKKTKWVVSSVASRHNPDARGASRLLGVNGLVLIGHGNARREAILSALESARREIELGLQPALAGRLAKISN